MTNNGEEAKNEIFKMVQDFLKPRPLIIWGSGATIPFGMPSMEDLKEFLEIEHTGNLEEALSEISSEEEKLEYQKRIFEIINEKDATVRDCLSKDGSKLGDIEKLIRYFHKAHPQTIDIITTNYDCILEYVLSNSNIQYSDGFNGKEFSKFDEENFKSSKQINLYKVHGSLRWNKERYSYYNSEMDAIFPSKKKYEESSRDPFRAIISVSDKAIKNVRCFLSIGFGFNDKHITPRIESAIDNGCRIVVVTKEATTSTRERLARASNYILIENHSEKNTTRFAFKENKESETETVLEGSYWKLSEFNQILSRSSAT